MGVVRNLLNLKTVISPTTNIAFLIDKAHFSFENIFLCKPFGLGAYYPPCRSEMGVYVIRSITALGWLFLFLAIFMINHFELFGLRQIFAPIQGKPTPAATFKISGFYKIVRHPIQTGILIGAWAAPVSTASHLVFAACISAYLFIVLDFEEKDLIKEFADTYLDYMQRLKE